jgi:hypothetical protein
MHVYSQAHKEGVCTRNRLLPIVHRNFGLVFLDEYGKSVRADGQDLVQFLLYRLSLGRSILCTINSLSLIDLVK